MFALSMGARGDQKVSFPVEYVYIQVPKTFSKNVQGCRDGSAITTGTRLYMYGSVQARQITERLHK